MERPRAPLLLATRLLAVVSAVGLAAGYVIFAQVNGTKQSTAPLPIPPLETQTVVLSQKSQTSAREDLPYFSVRQVLQSSSKSGMLTNEATAIVAGEIMSVGSVTVGKTVPPTPTPDYLLPSSKSSVIRHEAEAVISVTGPKALPPAPTLPPLPRVPNAPSSGFAPLTLPVATPVPAAR